MGAEPIKRIGIASCNALRVTWKGLPSLGDCSGARLYQLVPRALVSRPASGLKHLCARGWHVEAP